MACILVGQWHSRTSASWAGQGLATQLQPMSLAPPNVWGSVPASSWGLGVLCKEVDKTHPKRSEGAHVLKEEKRYTFWNASRPVNGLTAAHKERGLFISSFPACFPPRAQCLGQLSYHMPAWYYVIHKLSYQKRHLLGFGLGE